MMRRFGMFVVVLCCVLAFATPALGADYPTPPFDTNAKCLGCHSVAVAGGAFTKTDFGVSTVLYERCISCHAGISPTKYAHEHFNADGACGQCHWLGGRLIVLPKVSTPFGYFADTSWFLKSPAEIHAAHTSGGPVDTEWNPALGCGRCHAPVSCTACHGDTVPHASHVTSGYPAVTYRQTNGIKVTSSATTCVTPSCHGWAVSSVAACGTCHPTKRDTHGYENADHVADDGLATGIACSACHSLDLSTEHNKPTSSSAGAACGACHPSPRDTLAAWDQSCVTGGCHSSTSSAPVHGATTEKHAVVPSATTCLGCHAGTDLGSLHSLATTTTADGVKTSCLVCHTATGSPTTNDCFVCHAGVADAQGHYSLHAADPAPTLECVGCHNSNLVDEHLGVAGAGIPRKDMSGAALTCATCHASADLAVVTAIATGSTACNSCHTLHDPALSTTHTSTFTPAGDDGCSGCHSANLDTEHEGLSVTTSGGATLTKCALCHDNTEGARGLQVQTAIETTNDTRCTACHAGYHGGATQSHSATSSASVAGCGACHKEGLSAEGVDVVAVHAGVASPGPCAVCHSNPSRVPNLSVKTAECASCHSTQGTDYHGSMALKHLAPASASCQACHHSSQDVTQVHKSGCTTCHNGTVVTKGITTACANCHKQEGVDYHPTIAASHTPTDTASTDCAGCHKTADVRDLHVTNSCSTCHTGNCSDCHGIHLKKTTACATCHKTSGTDYHSSMATAHTYTAMDSSCAASGCHAAKTLPEAHEPFLSRYPQYGTTCALCHQNTDTARINWTTATADCSTCHTVHADVGTIHTATAPERCFTCHKTADAFELHKGRVEGKCAVCHANPTKGNLAAGKANTNCDGCHVTEGTDYHATMSASHTGLGTSGTCLGAGCHPSRDVTEVHARYVGPGKQFSQYPDTCSLCHLNTDSTRINWSVINGSSCASCHGIPHDRQKHAATSTVSAECTGCHGSTWVVEVHKANGNSGGSWSNCDTCHNNPVKGDLTWDKTTSDCEQCHTKSPAATKHYTATAHVATESSDCAACHKLELAAEHIKASSKTVDCLGCHTSTLYTGLKTPWAKTCAECHTAKHGEQDAKHISTTSACAGSGCHDLTDASAVHSKLANGGCSACHTNDSTVPASTDCNSCHAGTYHASKAVKHTATASASCARCHDKDPAAGMDVEPIHKNVCATCHVASARVPDVSAKTAECASCHATSGTDYHKAMAGKHTFGALDPSCITAGCHTAGTLPEEHARFVGAGGRYASYQDSCALCHENTSATRIDWATASADCSSCHTVHGDIALIHEAPSSAECVDCHETADVRSVHAVNPADSCVVCHKANYDLTGKTTACVDCHAYSPTATKHYPAAKHLAAETGCTLCHSLDMKTEHAKPTVAVTCAACHETKVDTFTTAWNKTCLACHATKHTLAAQKHVSTNVACGAAGCHAIGDASDIHKGVQGGGCAVCHAAGVTPTTNCLSCHANVGTNHHELHNGIAANTGGCSGCHSLYLDTEHALLGLTCATCHDSTRADVQAAITGGKRNCTACHPAAHGKQAVEFDASNASMHRVRADLPGMRSSFVVNGATYTWALPSAASFLKAGFTTSSVTACDSCHTFSGTASGPHGSTVKVNIDPAYPTSWKSAYLTNSSNGINSTTMICAKCHDLNGTGSNFSNKVHDIGDHQGSTDGKCVLCHVQVPHGWGRPRLLGYTTDPAPYATTGLVQLKLKSYTPNQWAVADCQTSCGEHDSAVSTVWPGAPAAVGSITGTVRNSAGLVLPGAIVTTDKGQTATAGTSGTYTLAGVPVGTVTVTASAAGYVSTARSVSVLRNTAVTADFALNPVPTGTLTGAVTDAASGVGLSGVTVSVTGGTTASTAGNGTYSLAAMPTGTYTVTFSKPGFTTITQSVTIVQGSNTLNVVMTAAPTNLAQGKTFSASRTQSSTYAATKAGDGDVATWWWSNQSGGSTTTEWLKVDLGVSTSIKTVEVAWFSTYFAREFRVYTSTDNSNWTQVYSTTSGVAGTSTVNFTARNARYVRVECRRTGSGRSNGYGIAEMRVFQ